MMASRAIRKLLISGESLEAYTETHRDRDKDQLERRQILEEMTRNMADSAGMRGVSATERYECATVTSPADVSTAGFGVPAP